MNDKIIDDEIIDNKTIMNDFNFDLFEKELFNFRTILSLMKQLHIEFKTYSLIGFPDKKLEKLWNNFCAEM